MLSIRVGIAQAWSAYFSFKVLPELNDPGYYSDKAILSRTFVHENVFFTTMAVFGSIYYNAKSRTMMRTNLLGRCLEFVFVFWPYFGIRSWFPVTKFSDAGSGRQGRSVRNQRFYEFGTLSVKIFFLWAKYFLGFYINWMVYLDLLSPENWKFQHGMALLNVGTVSIAVFLHTLRFRKVLPAKFTFSVYLAQIYATFSALPLAYDMFVDHPKLVLLALVGLVGNLTPYRKTCHGLFCLLSSILLNYPGIQW
jgi:hypothetical protein